MKVVSKKRLSIEISFMRKVLVCKSVITHSERASLTNDVQY